MSEGNSHKQTKKIRQTRKEHWNKKKKKRILILDVEPTGKLFQKVFFQQTYITLRVPPRKANPVEP